MFFYFLLLKKNPKKTLSKEFWQVFLYKKDCNAQQG
jgi:hypothetical protein